MLELKFLTEHLIYNHPILNDLGPFGKLFFIQCQAVKIRLESSQAFLMSIDPARANKSTCNFQVDSGNSLNISVPIFLKILIFLQNV